jgi:hypothetical protein
MTLLIRLMFVILQNKDYDCSLAIDYDCFSVAKLGYGPEANSHVLV